MGKLIDCDIIPLGSDSEATVKSRFYLDKLIRINDGFVGACVDGGGQQNMHNPTRFGSIRFLQNGVIYRAFTDGGASTLGVASSEGSIIARYTNYIIVPGSYLSAYNVDSSIIGFQIRKDEPDSIWIDFNYGFLAKNTSKNENFTMRWGIPPFTIGQVVVVRPYIVNDEGVFYGQERTFTLPNQLNIYPARYNGAVSSCDLGTEVSIIFNNAYTYVYSHIDPDTGNFVPASAGWYNGWFNLNKSERIRIDATGLIQERHDCSTPEPVISPIYASVGQNFSSPGQPVTYSAFAETTVALSVDVTVNINLVCKNSSGGSVQSRSYDLEIPALSTGVVKSANFPMPAGGVLWEVVSATATPGLVDGKTLNPVNI